jgi:hypothetical protein
MWNLIRGIPRFSSGSGGGLFAVSDLGDGQHGRGRTGSDLVGRRPCRGRDVGEPIEESIEGGVAVVDGVAFLVRQRNGGAHALQVVLGFEQLSPGRALGDVEIAAGASHSVRALLEEAVGAPAVAEVVVLPGFSGGGRAGGDGIAVDEDLDGADVASPRPRSRPWTRYSG